MLVLLPKIIVILGSICLYSGLFLPAMTVMSYMIFRPLIQPYAWLQYKLFGLPIGFAYSLFVISLGIILPFTRRGWSLNVGKNGFFVLFMVVALISISVSEYLLQSMAALIKLFTVWFLCNIAYNCIKSEEDAARIMNALVISAVIPLLFGFYQAVTGSYDLIYDSEVNRISSVFVTGNDYGIFLTFVTAAVAVRLGTATTRRMRILMMIVMAMILVSQVLSLNRGTWIALTMGFVVATAKYHRYLNFKLIIMVGGILLLFFSGVMIERFAELKDPSSVHYSNRSTLEGRIAYWKRLIPIIMEHPLRGYGIGTSTIVAEKRFKKQQKPHNDYLQIAVDLGVFGLLAYVAFLTRIFFYFALRRVSGELWVWNFSMLMLSVYFIVISGAQNIVQSILNFPIFMILVAVVFKLNEIASAKVVEVQVGNP